MSATNHTTNYNLPQFLGTDKPAWLVDFNGAMTLIDTTIKTIADLVSSAEGDIAVNTSDISQLITDLTTVQGSLTTLQGVVSQNIIDIASKAPTISPQFTGNQPQSNGDVLILNEESNTTPIRKVESMTEAEYELITPVANTFYVLL